MSSAERKELLDKIWYGLQIAERKMLHDKASRNEDVIVCGADGVIRHIPAKEVIANNPMFQ